jgi:hypothetical protein
MMPAKKSEPAAAVESARRRSASRPQASAPAPAADVVTTTGAADEVASKKAGPSAGKRIAAGKVKMPAPSAETTVKRAVPVKATAPVEKAGVRKAGKQRGAVQA